MSLQQAHPAAGAAIGRNQMVRDFCQSVFYHGNTFCIFHVSCRMFRVSVVNFAEVSIKEQVLCGPQAITAVAVHVVLGLRAA